MHIIIGFNRQYYIAMKGFISLNFKWLIWLLITYFGTVICFPVTERKQIPFELDSPNVLTYVHVRQIFLHKSSLEASQVMIFAL